MQSRLVLFVFLPFFLLLPRILERGKKKSSGAGVKFEPVFLAVKENDSKREITTETRRIWRSQIDLFRFSPGPCDSDHGGRRRRRRPLKGNDLEREPTGSERKGGGTSWHSEGRMFSNSLRRRNAGGSKHTHNPHTRKGKLSPDKLRRKRCHSTLVKSSKRRGNP